MVVPAPVVELDEPHASFGQPAGQQAVVVERAVTDQKNTAPPGWLSPILVGGVVVAIGVAFGFNAGYAINPARDFGPRLFTAIAGWGPDVFTAANGWWWVPVGAPIVGGMVGAIAYDFLVVRYYPQGLGAR